MFILWWTNKKLWKDPPFLMGKSTISMAIFHCKLLVHQRLDLFHCQVGFLSLRERILSWVSSVKDVALFNKRSTGYGFVCKSGTPQKSDEICWFLNWIIMFPTDFKSKFGYFWIFLFYFCCMMLYAHIFRHPHRNHRLFLRTHSGFVHHLRARWPSGGPSRPQRHPRIRRCLTVSPPVI